MINATMFIILLPVALGFIDAFRQGIGNLAPNLLAYLLFAIIIVVVLGVAALKVLVPLWVARHLVRRFGRRAGIAAFAAAVVLLVGIREIVAYDRYVNRLDSESVAEMSSRELRQGFVREASITAAAGHGLARRVAHFKEFRKLPDNTARANYVIDRTFENAKADAEALIGVAASLSRFDRNLRKSLKGEGNT